MKKLLSVFVMVALLVTSLCPAFLVIAADDLTAGNETHNYDAFTIHMDDITIYEGETKADVGLYWDGNTAEINPDDIQGATLFIYYPKTLTFAGFKTSEEGIPDSDWVNWEEDKVLDQENVDAAANAAGAFEACGVDVPAGPDSEYRFVKLLLDRALVKGNLDPSFYNGLLGTLSFNVAADAQIGTYEIGLATKSAYIMTMNPATYVEPVLVKGGVTVAQTPVAQATVSVGAATGMTGGEVTVPVQLDANSGIFIARLGLEYDHSIFTVKEITAGDVFTEPNHFLSSVDENGNIMLYFEAGENADVTGTGTLANVTFTVATPDKVAGEYQIAPTAIEILNYAEEELAATMVPGTVTIGVSETMKVEVAEVSGPRFQEVSVPVSVGRNTEGIWAIRAEFAYDKTALKFVGVEDGLFSVAEGYSEADGIVTVFIEKDAMQNVTDVEGVLYTLKFKALTEGVTPINMTVKEVINLDEQNVDFLSVNGSVTVTPCEHVSGETYTAVTKEPTMYEEGVLSTFCKECDAVLSTEPIAKVTGLAPEKTEQYAGQQAKVPVNLLNNPGLVSVGAEFVYNPQQMTFAGLESGLFAADQFSVSDKDGKLTIYVESPEVANITEDGVAFYMLFDIPEAATILDEYTLTGAPLEKYNVNADEEYVRVDVDNGIVKVKCPHTDKLPAETIEPNCDEPGYIVEKCALCGEVVTKEVDPAHPEALGHVEGEGVVTKEATCTEEGVMTYYCTRCNKELRSEPIAKIDHVEGTGVVTKEATCTEEGEMTYYCTVCENVVRTEPIAKIDHVEDAGTVTKEATCTEEGVMTYTCTVCHNVTRTEPIAKIDHVENAGVVTKEATCTEEGVMTFSCSVCGEVLRTESIPKLDHVLGEWEVEIPATETEDGLEVQRCTICGEIINERVIPATGTDTTDPDDTQDAGDTTEPDDTQEPGDTTKPGVTTGEDTTKEPADSTAKPGTDDKNPPKTGDYMIYIIVIAVVAVIGCAAVVIIRKKKTSEK